MNSLKRLVYSLEPTVVFEGELENIKESECGEEGPRLREEESRGPDDGLDNQDEKVLDNRDSGSEKGLQHKNVSAEKGDLGNEKEDQGNEKGDLANEKSDVGEEWFLQTVGGAVGSMLYGVVVHPVLLVWLLMTFPFTYMFGSEYHDLEAGEAGTGETPANDEKAALLKEEKIIANHIKTPTAYKYILPPPPRLFPLSRNPEKKRRKKTLILDLDETLIHSLSRGAPRSLGASNSCHMIELKINNIPTLYYVYKRPFCDFFLKEVAQWFELQIFTASVKEYADPIIDWLESDIIDYKNGTQSVFSKRYYRSDCTFRSGVGYIKDLSRFCSKEEELKNVIILDNSPVSYALHEDNAIMIEGWINDPSDRDLLNLLPMLYSLSVCIDVRFILGLRGGEKLFEAARS